MNAPAQRATLVLEHMSATEDQESSTTDVEHEKSDKPWNVVAYLIYDSGQRRRVTLCHCRTRDEAAEALEKMWGTLVG